MKPKASKPREVARVAELNGFVFDRQNGSHAVYVHKDKRRIVISMHKRDVKKGLLNNLIGEIGLTVEQYNKQV